MELFPAIEIRNGRLIRPSGVDRPADDPVGPDPVAWAEQLAWQGARWLHVTDLDRAFGDGDNSAVIGRIVTRVGSFVRIQLTGGLREPDTLRPLRDLEVTRFVLEPSPDDGERLTRAIEILGVDRVAVGLDVRDDLLLQLDWRATAGWRAVDVLRRAVAAGVRTAVYRDMNRHGMLSGLNVAQAAALQAEGAGIVAAGGAASLGDLRAAREAHLAGVVVGRALYEGRFSLADALQTCQGD
jgi:phosphoribosylformimino-5-aminoimidazole carboxamide ribotide isomerase